MDTTFYVLIPVYQAEKYIDECVKSVVNQTYRNYHIILVDDGSTDRSGMICDSLQKQYDFVYVVHQQNKGQLSARLSAVNYARKLHVGQVGLGYLFFLDADDVIDRKALEYLAWIIEKKTVDCVVIDWIRFTNTEEIQYIDFPKEKLSERIEYIEKKSSIYKRVFTENSLNSMCRKVVNIKKFPPNKDYSQLLHFRNGEDLIQSIDIYRDISSIAFSNTCLYYYRQNFESVTHKKPSIDNAVDFTVRELVLDFLDSTDDFFEDDYLEYYKYCRDLILGEMLICINGGMKISEINELADCISSSKYYCRVTHNGTNLVCTNKLKSVLLRLLMKKHTREICISLLKVVCRTKREIIR